MPYLGYELDCIPHNIEMDYPRIIAHHITEEFPDYTEDGYEYIGEGNDRSGWIPEIYTILSADGVQCACVSMRCPSTGFVSFRNSNGNRYHVTLSLAEGKRPVESNRLIEKWENKEYEGQVIELENFTLSVSPLKEFK